MIFGLTGACRGGELTNLTVSNIKDDGKEVIVKIPETKNKDPKFYIVGDEFAKIIREYMMMRPPAATSDRLFYQWRKGKCVNQVMGKHSIAKIPKDVATFLKLPEPSSYTGHSYRRTGTTLAANAGFSMIELKRFGGWKSDRVCEGYIQNSLKYKRQQAKRISDAINLPQTTNGDPSPHVSSDVDNDMGVGDIASENVPAMVEKSTDLKVASLSPNTSVTSLPISNAASPKSLGSTSFPISDLNRNEHGGLRKDDTSTSINFTSPSEFTISGAGTSLSISGADISSAKVSDGNEGKIIFHFGTCASVTIINMK